MLAAEGYPDPSTVAFDVSVREVVERLVRNHRSSLLVGVLVATTAPGQMQLLVDRLQQQLEQAGTPTSVGHAPYTAAAGFAGAWRRADEAMYQQKAQRRRIT